VGAMIAGYTLADSHGVQHADPVTYLELVLAPTAIAMLAWEWRRRPLRPELNARNAASGAGMMLAYGLVLAALSLASAAAVAALRETSVVIAALLAAVAARRPPDRGRLAGAVLVAVGVAAISLS
jgi:drug/metabolite transporter (DMT)-like permease